MDGIFKSVHELQLLKAVRNGLINKTEVLLSLNPIQSNDKRYFDYYLIIEALKNYQIKLVKLLIEKGFRVYKKSKSNKERTVLHAATIQSKSTDLISTLLTKGASLDILTSDEKNKTPFHLAIDCNKFSTIELFLSQFDAKTFDEKCFLHYAIENYKVQVILPLITKGLSLKKKNENKLTPFCIALKNKKFKVLNILLSHYSVKNINSNNYDDIAPVYIASICGNLKIIKEYADSGLSINIPLKLNADIWTCLYMYPGFTLLHLAVKHVKLEVVEFLLSKGADILVQNENGSSPLHIAFITKEKRIWKTWQAFGDSNSIIDLILKYHTIFHSNPINKYGLSHFHIACSRDKPTVVEHFLKLKAPINEPVKPQFKLYKEFSPLHFSAKFGCKKTMELLLKNGADVKQKDSHKMTALHIAAKESCLDVVSLLLQYGSDVASVDSYGNTPIHWAFKNKNYGIVDLLLSVSNVANSNPTNNEGVSHFHIACTRNSSNVVKNFIENGVLVDTCVPAQSQKNDWSGYSPLHFAVSHNRARIVQLLLSKGANVGMKDNKGFTPLHMAYQYTHEMFGELIKTTLCDLNKHGKINTQLKPLADIVWDEKYVNRLSGSIGKINWFSNRNQYMKIISSLLDNGSDVNCIDNKGNTSVFYAYAAVTEIKSIIENNLNCSEALWAQILEDLSGELYERRKLILNNLMKLDVNLDKCCKNGSILCCISSNKDKESDEMMELFLKKGANVEVRNDEMLTPLHKVTLSADKNLISTLLDYGANVDCIDPEDSTPLLIATSTFELQSFSYDIIKILIDKGANANARQPNGRTALHNLALIQVDKHIARTVFTLVKAGANINSRDSNGLTPLHIACNTKNVDMLLALLMFGADINVEDNKKRSSCCYLYKRYLKNLSVEEHVVLPSNLMKMINALQRHIIKINVIGLSITKKALSSYSKFDRFMSKTEKEELIRKYQTEVKLLQETKIHGNCTLYNVIHKNENALSQLVENPAFKAIIVQTKSFSFCRKYRNYGYLIQLKNQAGVDRANLLPEAKYVLNNLLGLHLPDECSENIYKHFTNVELKESIEILRGILDLKIESSDHKMQLRSRKTHKHQKTN